MENNQDNDLLGLVEKAVDGDQGAITSLYEMYKSQMIGIVHNRLGKTLHGLMESVDLVQSVWREILDDIHDFEYQGEDSFSRWLNTCLINKIHAKRRYFVAEKRNPKNLIKGEFQENAPYPMYDATPSHDAMTRENLDALMRVMHNLPEIQQQVLVLRMRDEKKYSHISKIIGKSEEAAKKIYQRGLNALIQQLSGKWGDPA